MFGTTDLLILHSHMGQAKEAKNEDMEKVAN